MEFTVYTDGGCSGNKRDAGCNGAWAYIALDPANTVLGRASGLEVNTTNNRMELTAVIKALTLLKAFGDNFFGGAKIHDCIVVSDSKYVINNFEEYVPEWKNNGWRKSGGGSVVNIDLWKQLCSLSPEFKSVKFKWVKGHSTSKFNQEADALVRKLLY